MSGFLIWKASWTYIMQHFALISAYSAPILRIGDQVLTFDVFWPKHLQEVRSTVYIHVQSIWQM